eukprot:2873636-Rhodomonas_salina.1
MSIPADGSSAEREGGEGGRVSGVRAGVSSSSRRMEEGVGGWDRMGGGREGWTPERRMAGVSNGGRGGAWGRPTSAPGAVRDGGAGRLRGDKRG